MNIQHILVVCVGNICRSPMAEYFLKQQFPQLDIQSAGLSALVGQFADPKAIQPFCVWTNVKLIFGPTSPDK